MQKKKSHNLNSQGMFLHTSLSLDDVFGDFGGLCVIGQIVGSVQLGQIVHDSLVGQIAPQVGEQELVFGRGQSLLQRASGAGEDADGGVDVDGRVGDAIQLHLMIHHLFPVFPQQEFASDAEVFDGFRRLFGAGGQLGMRVVLNGRTRGDAEETHGAFGAFLRQHARIGQRVLDLLEQRPQVAAGELKARQRNEES